MEAKQALKMADIIGVQIIGMLFGFFMMYYTFLHYKRKEFTFKEYGFWMLFWAVFVLLAIFPQVLDPVLETLNISRALDFFIITGFLFLIFVNIYTYTLVRKTQRKLEEAVRKTAFSKK